MNEPAEKPHLRRAAVGALALALPLGALALAAVNVLQARETNDLATRQVVVVEALERRVAKFGGDPRARRDASAVYLAGDGVELARAELQKMLVEAIAVAGGKLIETQEPGQTLEPDAPDDGRVELRVTFDARNDGLLDLLHGLETRLPLLTVERLEARRLDAGGDADPADPTLRIGLVVRGHRKLPA